VRALLATLLVVSVAAAQAREAGAILADHVASLGAADRVRTLTYRSQVHLGSRTFPQCETVIVAGRGSAKTLHAAANVPPQSEWVSGEGTYMAAAGRMWRVRPNQVTSRALYHVLNLLAEPFPLLAYARSGAARKNLKAGSADGYEALRGPVDAYGVHCVYLLDEKTHHLRNVRFYAESETVIATVTFDDHRLVEGVTLPHQVTARFVLVAEDAEKKKFGAQRLNRSEVIQSWEINGKVDATRLIPPGKGSGAAKGFERHVLATGTDPHECGAGDLDGDGKIDLAVACWDGVFVHFGGALDKPVPVKLGQGRHRGLVVDDIDGDGRLDIVTTCNVGPPEMYFVVTFDAQRMPRTHRIHGAPFQTHALKARDLDFDGIPDFVATGYGSRKLHIDPGNGAGGLRMVGVQWPLQTRSATDRRGLGLDVGHLDADRLFDIAVCDGKRVVIFQGEANLSFQPRVDVQAGPRPVDVAFVDLNGDGRQDLVVANESPLQDIKGDIAVLLNTGKGLRQHVVVEAGKRTPSLAVGRFDPGADPDIAVASVLTGAVSLLYGDGLGGLGKLEALASGRGTHRVIRLDADRDGRDDILAVNNLDDTLSLFLNRRDTVRIPHRAPPRAVECVKLEGLDFTLKGLTRTYTFAAEFRIPAAIRDPSGLAFLGGTRGYTQLVFVSDKRPALFRATLDRSRGRMLVGPALPLVGLEPGRLDLEGLAFDHRSGNLFMACEADGHVLRATALGHVIGRAPTGIESGANDGLEAIALRRKLDGTPLLYVFRERVGMTMRQPALHVFGLEEDPFALAPRQVIRLPVVLPDQTGAAVIDDRIFVVSRLLRTIVEIEFDGAGLSKQFKLASFRKLSDEMLGLVNPDNRLYGLVEGIAFDEGGDMYLLVDNNGQEIGVQGRNRGREGRLLWFRASGPRKARHLARRVVIRQIHIPWAGAQGNPKTSLSREEAAKIAAECIAAAKAGTPFASLTDRHHYTESTFEPTMTLVAPPTRPAAGELSAKAVPRALRELAFGLDVGEVGLCEFHETESPYGFHIVQRVR